jgi:hypothetical protein
VDYYLNTEEIVDSNCWMAQKYGHHYCASGIKHKHTAISSEVARELDLKGQEFQLNQMRGKGGSYTLAEVPSLGEAEADGKVKRARHPKLEVPNVFAAVYGK